MTRTSPLYSSSVRRGRSLPPPGCGESRPARPSPQTPGWNSPAADRSTLRRARCGRSQCALQSRRSYCSAPRRVARSRRHFALRTACLNQPSLVLLDYPLQIGTHLRNRLSRDRHLAALSASDDDVELAVARVLLRKVVTEVATATLLPLERGTRNDLRHRQEILEIERRVPSRIVLAISGDGNLGRPLSETPQRVECALHLLFAADDADELLHHRLQIVLDLERALAAGAVERL